MNARIADEVNSQIVKELFESAKKMAESKGISIAEAIDYKISVSEKYAKTHNESIAWYLRGVEAKKMII